MKLRELIRHLETNGCVLQREGGRHSVILIREPVVPPPCPGTAKSRNLPPHAFAEISKCRVRLLTRSSMHHDSFCSLW